MPKSQLQFEGNIPVPGELKIEIPVPRALIPDPNETYCPPPPISSNITNNVGKKTSKHKFRA